MTLIYSATLMRQIIIILAKYTKLKKSTLMLDELYSKETRFESTFIILNQFRFTVVAFSSVVSLNLTQVG